MSLPSIRGERAAQQRDGKQNGRSPPARRAPSITSSTTSNSADDAGGAPVGSSTSAGQPHARAEVSDFRIVVAARIRPFTEREVRQWQLEQRSTATAAAAENTDDGGDGARRGRSTQRQPFGPDHKELHATAVSLDGSWTRRHDDGGNNSGDPLSRTQQHRLGSGFGTSGSGMPHPVVEVESDGKTVVLLDTQHIAAEGLSMAPVRNAFTYDHVYSSFAPNVELDGAYHNAPSSLAALRKTDTRGATGASPYVILDGDDNALTSASSHTREEDANAEAEQLAIYEQLAVPLVDAALHGYNTCMFAYGQTGSGKTYTMMGTARHPGLIPRLCELLFSEVAQRNKECQRSSGTSTSNAAAVVLQLSYMEIYNEQVRDLLKQRPKNAILRYKSRFDKKDIDCDEYRTLKVRHHPSKGIYVEGLTSTPVRTREECESFLQQGNALRTQCSTAMNAKSSRSHAIFQLHITQRESTGGRVRGREVALETFSKINLVDLAGSERNTQAKTTGKHLAEANSINASLSTLRRVLEGLISTRCGTAPGGTGNGPSGTARNKKSNVVIPYRESLLTYVLSDNLGGNSFTVMCANVSPCAANAGETESTLRYAMLARGVVNHAKLNEAPTARVIREMKDQLKVMQEALRNAPDPSHVAELEEGVRLSEALLREMKQREEGYEAQLQTQAAQAETLRQAVAAHKRQETYWREEAQRQQREMDELRTALLEATHNNNSGGDLTDALSRSETSKASEPSMRLPQLQCTLHPATLHAEEEEATEGRKGGVNTRKNGTKPAAASKRISNAAAAAASAERSAPESGHSVLTPASNDWKPNRTRGTPLSLMGLRENRRVSSRSGRNGGVNGEGVLPALATAAPSSAPEIMRGRSTSTHASGAKQPSRAASKPCDPSLTPKPPLAKPLRQQQQPSKPVPTRGKKRKNSPGAGATLDNGLTSPFSVRDQSGADAAARSPDKQLLSSSDVPALYHTEHFLTPAADSIASLQTQTPLLPAPLEAKPVASNGARGEKDEDLSSFEHTTTSIRSHYSQRGAHVPPLESRSLGKSARHRRSHESVIMSYEEEEADEVDDSCEDDGDAHDFLRGATDGVFEAGGLTIQGVAATPSHERPTHSPGVAPARLAQAAQDRRRSSILASTNAAAAATAATATAAKGKPKKKGKKKGKKTTKKTAKKTEGTQSARRASLSSPSRNDSSAVPAAAGTQKAAERSSQARTPPVREAETAQPVLSSSQPHHASPLHANSPANQGSSEGFDRLNSRDDTTVDDSVTEDDFIDRDASAAATDDEDQEFTEMHLSTSRADEFESITAAPLDDAGHMIDVAQQQQQQQQRGAKSKKAVASNSLSSSVVGKHYSVVDSLY